MSTPNLNVLLTAALASYDNLAPNTPLLANINPGSLPFNATAYFYNEYFKTSGTVQIPLPTCYVLWVRNRDASASITVAPTFSIFGPQLVVIGPGDLFLYFNASKTTGYIGLTLSVQAGGSALCELYMAG